MDRSRSAILLALPLCATLVPAQEPASVPAQQPAFAARAVEIASTYETWDRVDDERPKWSPLACRLPRPGRGRFSASDDDATHGRKLYYLYAKRREAYRSAADDIDAPGQVVVKEAWEPVAVHGLDPARTRYQLEPRSDRPYAERDGRIFRAGDRAGLFVMFRLDPDTPGTDDGWVYATLAPDRRTVTAAGRIASCMSCHDDAPRGRLFGPETAARTPRAPAARDWPQWRGPLGTGSAPDSDPPVEWSEKHNVRWKRELPGRGHSSPIVAGERVYVTTAIPYGDELEPVPDDMPGAHDNAPLTRRQDFTALALDRTTGEVVWRRSLRRFLPHAGAHRSGTLASSSPVTDGERVYAYFGSAGLYALDAASGEPLWDVDLGDMSVKHGHGEGSSPVLHGDTIAVNWDHEEQSFLVALDKRTGAERWRVARDEVTSWATPIVVEHAGTAQLIVSGTMRVRAYDLASGEVIWECGGLSHNVVASPVAADGMVFVASSYEKRAMFAVRLDGAAGDIKGSDHVVWQRRRRTPYVPSPLLRGSWLYFLNHYQGVLSRVNAKTGAEPAGPFRLGGLFEVYASPVASRDRVYVTDRDGTTVVIGHTEDGEPEPLARNVLDDGFSASAAIAGDELFLRGHRFLYCIAADRD